MSSTDTSTVNTTTVTIVSSELNAYFAALALTARGERCAIHGRAAETVDAEVFGVEHTLHLFDGTVPSGEDGTHVAMLGAEGEDVADGFAIALAGPRPDLVIIVGGGVSGIVDARAAAERHGYDLGRVFVVSAFIFGGIPGEHVVVNSEKLGLLSAYLGSDVPADARELAARIVPTAEVTDLLTMALSSVNALIHPVPMILNATSIERGEPVRFFVEGFGGSVARVALALDAERLALGARLGLELPSFDELLSRYYAAEGISDGDLQDKVNTFRAYQQAIVPSTFHHRYLEHEIRANLGPMRSLMRALDVPSDTTSALITLGELLADRELTGESDAVARTILEAGVTV